MKIARGLAIAAGWAALTMTAVAAEETFSQSVPKADFAAAGLARLTPQELARLDALVRDFKSGALEAARREAAIAAEARAKAEASAARAEAEMRVAREEARTRAAEAEKKSDTSLLSRAKVLLTPGTQIEYSTVETKIVGEFRGWAPRTVFTLANGQRWQVIGGDSYVTSAEPGPKVKIVPGVLGTFWMHVEGHRQRAKVALVSSGK